MPIIRSFPEKAFYLGEMFERAAERFAEVTVTLDHDLDVAKCGRELTVGSVAGLIAELAARLWAAGIRPAEHVVVHKRHDFGVSLLAMACSRVGAVPVLLSPALKPEIVTALMARLDRPRLLTDPDTLSQPGIRSTSDGSVLLVGAGRSGVPGLAGFAGAPARAAVRLHPGQPALITHTSGTTGLPKLVVHSAETLWWRLVPQVLLARPVRKQDPFAVCMSFSHSRLYSAIGTSLEYGMPLVLMSETSPDRVAETFVHTRPGMVETPPNCLMTWESLVEADGAPLSSVHTYSSTFDAAHPRTVHRVLSASKRSRPVFVQLYGQSETGPISGWVYSRQSILRTDGRCLGYPLPLFTRVRAVGRDGMPADPDHPGYLEVQTRGRALTYLGDEERFASQTDGSWWRLGDLGYLRRHRVHLLDREVDEITNVTSTLELEDKLLGRLEELAEVVIVHGDGGRGVPVLSTRDDSPLDPTRWQTAVSDLPELAEPVQWPLAELPRTSTWKTQRLELAQLLRESPRQEGVR
ncbi:class I adenylate-forming enzyme family protein [Amycolatopsis pithecellobii]|uniref:AMP-binding protein n=1 Tax=Amycolatopsis pithecellobii TaxID=664692 RepID=A0A6N7YN93_9PSEU|nr:class I adenylate-forming enzyme family protein [Amycolatopsis pithecellobii]MTD53338.1 AMP-binding protein [Amycolatopsis pithecellobii]